MAPRRLTGNRMLKVSVFTVVEAEEAVADLLEMLFAQPPALYTDEETLVTEVSVYCPDRCSWDRRERVELDQGLRRLRAAGVPLGRPRIVVRRLRQQDWAESWKRHFKPIDVRGRLLIKPSWSQRQPRPGQAVVILDPGLSFGTGQHPTTAFCLDQIVACLKPEQPVSLLDIGTGSGILAIAAAKLGYSRVDAIDIDVNSVRVARGNALRNGVTRRIRFLHSDLACLPVAGSLKYDVVCANLLAHLIVDQSARITRRVAAGGRLVLAGILENEFSRVRAACEEAGLSLLASKGARGWRSGVFAGQSAREARRKRAAIRDLA